MTDEWCELLARHRFLVGISIDGPPDLHDRYRVDKRGGPTSVKVLRGLELLRKHEVDVNVLCTVHAANQDRPLDVYRYFRDELGITFIQFIPIVERDNDTGFQEGDTVTDRSVDPAAWGAFLGAVFDEWVVRDVGTVFVQMFDAALASWCGLPSSLCIFRETCGDAVALEHNGDLYSCDHFVEPAHLLGNITTTAMVELVTSPQQRAFGQAKADSLPGMCRSCEVRFACNGECPRNRFATTPDGEYGLNYLCAVSYTHLSTGPSRPTAVGACPTTSRWPGCTPACVRCGSPTAPTRSIVASWPGPSWESTPEPAGTHAGRPSGQSPGSSSTSPAMAGPQ